jgi:hypothetical protein
MSFTFAFHEICPLDNSVEAKVMELHQTQKTLSPMRSSIAK